MLKYSDIFDEYPIFSYPKIGIWINSDQYHVRVQMYSNIQIFVKENSQEQKCSKCSETCDKVKT